MRFCDVCFLTKNLRRTANNGVYPAVSLWGCLRRTLPVRGQRASVEGGQRQFAARRPGL